MARARMPDAPPRKGGPRTPKRAEDPLVLAAEGLIVKGKEQGFLTPDDILGAFPDVRRTSRKSSRSTMT